MIEGTIQIIRAETARFYGVSLADIEGKSRTRRCVVPRHMAMLLCRSIAEKSYPEIARSFGGRDHTTVMHGVSQMRNAVNVDLDARQQYARLSAKVRRKLDAQAKTLEGIVA